MPLSLTIIGGGPGGYQAAVRAAQLGMDVAQVEKSALGGVCLHLGCIPSKTLKASAEALEAARRLPECGIRVNGDFQPDWPAILARKDQVIDLQTQGLDRLMAAHGVEVVRGRGRLLSPAEVEVELNDGGTRLIPSDRIILAAGSRPADLPGLERDGRFILNSNDVFSLPAIPKRLAIVGGGVIGCEFAGVFRALGSRVSLIEGLERLLPLPSLDPEISKLLAREMKKRRIAAYTGMVTSDCKISGQELTLKLVPSPFLEHPPRRAPIPRESVGDQVFTAVGRALNTQGLGLEAAGVDLDQQGAVKVDAGLRTSQANIFAVGDMLGTGRPMLAHMAGAEALVAAANAAGKDQTVSYDVVPSVAFTSPEAAWAGLATDKARERGLEAETHAFGFRALGKSQAMGRLAGVCKLVSETGSGRLLGAHIMGARAGELIHECALAMEMGASVKDLARTIHAHPTLSEAVHEAAEAALGQCLHAPPPRRGRAEG